LRNISWAIINGSVLLPRAAVGLLEDALGVAIGCANAAISFGEFICRCIAVDGLRADLLCSLRLQISIDFL